MPRPSWKSPAAVVPPRVQARVVVVLAEHVDEAIPIEVGERRALGRAHVVSADERGGVVHVDVGGSDVEVAGDDHVVAGARRVREWPRSRSSHRSLYWYCSSSSERPLGTYTLTTTDPAARRRDDPRLGVGLAVVGEADATSSRPTRLRMATPFHRPSPWWADS